MENISEYICGLLFVALIAVIIYFKKTQNKEPKEDKIEINAATEFPYEKTYLLTKNEWYFYKALKPIADKMGYSIITKVRLADLIKVKNRLSDKEKIKYFSKIKSKHLDFILCNPDNLAPVLIIELDDNSHNRQDRKERDSFVDTALTTAGYKILRVRGTEDLEEKIKNAFVLSRL